MKTKVENKYSSYFKTGEQINIREEKIFRDIQVTQQQSLPGNINISKILKKIERNIPEHFVQDLDGIYIGDYDFLTKRNLNALYQDGAIYVLSSQDSEEDLYNDIIHEIAHCVEEAYGFDIYDDGRIEQEFLRKRRRLFDFLKAYGYDGMSKEAFADPDYSKKFDEYLYINVGYPKIKQLTPDLFCSPYGATSLREYFANAFEEYFAKSNFKRVSAVAPSVLEKIEILLGSNRSY